MATNVKCAISSLDSSLSVEAHFNPRELSVEKQVPWNEQKTSKGDKPRLEFTDAAPAVLTVELLFDTFETGGDVHELYVSRLERMTQIIDPGSSDAERKRPPRCMFKWGNFPPFKGVIEQLAIKYTMFFRDGSPCRATATVRMKEFLEPAGAAAAVATSPGTEQGSTVGEGDVRRPDRYGGDHRVALHLHGSDDGRLTLGARVLGRRGQS
jgi:hypothetical protein